MTGKDIPTRMRAAWIDHLGPAEDIRSGDLPVPGPGPTDVLVHVNAVAVDPVDTLVRSGTYHTPTPFPFVIGRDLVGTVATANTTATGFTVGDQVWCNSMGHAGRQGAASEYVAVPANRLYRLPHGVDPEMAVAVLHPAATAHLALHTHAHLHAGQAVFVAGGAGHVGAVVITLAVLAGASVIATASADDLDHCRALGADVALDYRAADLATRLHDAAPDGVDVHLDTSGHHDLALATDLLAPRGRIILMAGATARADLPVGPLYTRDGRVIGFAISNATVPELADAARRINQLLAAGALVSRHVRVLPLADAATAHRLLETGQVRGTRLVLRV